MRTLTSPTAAWSSRKGRHSSTMLPCNRGDKSIDAVPRSFEFSLSTIMTRAVLVATGSIRRCVLKSKTGAPPFMSQGSLAVSSDPTRTTQYGTADVANCISRHSTTRIINSWLAIVAAERNGRRGQVFLLFLSLSLQNVSLKTSEGKAKRERRFQSQ